jgi:hypothetical protein
VDGDCSFGRYCLAGVCTARKSAGVACGAANECLNGFCVDGVCCASKCEGQCEACDVAGSVGACVAVHGDPHRGRTGCDGTGPCQGTCTGASRTACAMPGALTTCSPQTCEGTDVQPASVCDGLGTCTTPTVRSCGDAACVDGACAAACTMDSQCAAGRVCTNGTCAATAVQGGCAAAGVDGGLLLALLAMLATRRAGSR